MFRKNQHQNHYHAAYHLEATAGQAVSYRDSWRVFRIIAEFVDGYNFLKDLKKEVTILGSARLPVNHPYYKIAVELGILLGRNGFTTITGGGPGIMEAANKGAFESGGESIGLNIQLATEQRINPFVKKATAFNYFFTRKVMLTSPANAFVFFPGGFGTLDEFFEVVDHMEQGQMPVSPIILVGTDFWNPLIKFLRDKSCDQAHAVSLQIIDSWHVVNSADEAFAFIKDTKDRPNICSAGDNLFCNEGADWRIFRIMAELVDGFEFLGKIKNDVTVLGTKSFTPDSVYYNAAYQLGVWLAQNHLMVVTGGGPGIMEAANKGAFEMGGQSIGINIRTEHYERVNDYLTDSIGFFFPFIRKLMITAPSKAFVFFPGGFSTLHQLFELLTLQEAQKIDPIPTILYGREFWQPLLDYVRTVLKKEWQTINAVDENFIRTMDVAGEMQKFI